MVTIRFEYIDHDLIDLTMDYTYKITIVRINESIVKVFVINRYKIYKD